MTEGQSFNSACLNGLIDSPACDSLNLELQTYLYGAVTAGVIFIFLIAFIILRKHKLRTATISIVSVLALVSLVLSGYLSYRYIDLNTPHCINSGPIEEC